MHGRRTGILSNVFRDDAFQDSSANFGIAADVATKFLPVYVFADDNPVRFVRLPDHLEAAGKI